MTSKFSFFKFLSITFLAFVFSFNVEAKDNYYKVVAGHAKSLKGSFDGSKDSKISQKGYFYYRAKAFDTNFRIEADNQVSGFISETVYRKRDEYVWKKSDYVAVGKQAIKRSNRDLKASIARPKFNFFGLFKKKPEVWGPFVAETVKKKK